MARVALTHLLGGPGPEIELELARMALAANATLAEDCGDGQWLVDVPHPGVLLCFLLPGWAVCEPPQDEDDPVEPLAGQPAPPALAPTGGVPASRAGVPQELWALDELVEAAANESASPLP